MLRPNNTEAVFLTSIVRATIGDSKDVWLWRNDALTRQMSEKKHIIAWDEHSAWYENSLLHPWRYMFIGIVNNSGKIGICRFDIDAEKSIAEVSINLNPEFRGQNLSSKFLAKAIQEFFKNHNIDLVAKIKKTNTLSIKCFTKFGFVFDWEDKNCKYYKYSFGFLEE